MTPNLLAACDKVGTACHLRGEVQEGRWKECPHRRLAEEEMVSMVVESRDESRDENHKVPK